MHGVEMPASLLIDLHRDPGHYEKMVNAISKREGAARDAEARAGEREKLAEAAEAKALEAEGQAEVAEKKDEAARQRAEAAKAALGAKKSDIDAMHAAAVDRLQVANELSGRLVGALRGRVDGFAAEAKAILDAAL